MPAPPHPACACPALPVPCPQVVLKAMIGALPLPTTDLCVDPGPDLLDVNELSLLVDFSQVGPVGLRV